MKVRREYGPRLGCERPEYLTLKQFELLSAERPDDVLSMDGASITIARSDNGPFDQSITQEHPLSKSGNDGGREIGRSLEMVIPAVWVQIVASSPSAASARRLQQGAIEMFLAFYVA